MKKWKWTRWTEKELKYLKENYPKKHSKEIAKTLNKNYRVIQQKANRLGIKGINHIGKNNGNYKGGRWLDKTHGYIILSGKYECPYSDKRGRVKEHEYIWWKKYGTKKPILKGELIHHKNEKRDDNRIRNLEKMTKKAHTKHHNRTNKNKFMFLSKKERNRG